MHYGYQPRWLFDTTVGGLNWQIRVGAYIGLLTDIYPPVGDEAPKLAEATA